MERKLTFAALDARIEALPEFPEKALAFKKRGKWGFPVAAAGALFGLLCAAVRPFNAAITDLLVHVGLWVEIGGAIVYAASQLPDKWPTFANSRRASAERLDFGLKPHRELIEWLREFPLQERERLKEFVSYRHERLKERLPMLIGNIEKLGALPIVLALYLQFKDLHWPPHPSWIEVFLIFVLIFGQPSPLVSKVALVRWMVDLAIRAEQKELRQPPHHASDPLHPSTVYAVTPH